MKELEKLIADPRVTVRRSVTVNLAGTCVVYWMQRSMRAIDNHALDFAVAAANALQKSIVVFLAAVPFYPRANLLKSRFH